MGVTEEELKGLVGKYAAEQREAEVVWFHNQAKQINPKIVVEIGVKDGGNLKVLSMLVPNDGMIIGIDVATSIKWDMNDAHCKSFYISGSSHADETLTKVKKVLNGNFIDVLFIDGDHSYKGMLKDYELYSPLVRRGGIIAVHDIHYLPDVTKAWDDIPVAQKFESEKLQSSIGIGYVYKE